MIFKILLINQFKLIKLLMKMLITAIQTQIKKIFLKISKIRIISKKINKF